MFKLRFKNNSLDFLFFNIPILSFSAISGPHGKGAAPPGKYYVSMPIPLHVTDDTRAYTLEQFAFWAKIEPTFPTSRTGLGIHPDGNVAGTLGCIGIRSNVVYCFVMLYIFRKWTKRLELNVI